MPVYNSCRLGQLFHLAIGSVLSQTLEDFELIVVNDGSTDGTEEIVKGYKDSRIRYFSKSNGGTASARNLGIKMAKGAYIAYCDHDDILFPAHLEALAGMLDKDRRLAVVYADTLDLMNGKLSYGRSIELNYENCEERLLCVGFVNAVHRKEMLDKTGLFDEAEELRFQNETLDLWLRVIDKYAGGMLHVREPLSYFIFHGHNRKMQFKDQAERETKYALTEEYVLNKRYAALKKQKGARFAKVCLNLISKKAALGRRQAEIKGFLASLNLKYLDYVERTRLARSLFLAGLMEEGVKVLSKEFSAEKKLLEITGSYLEKNYAKTIELSEKLISELPFLADPFYYQSLAYLAENNVQKARERLERALALDPRDQRFLRLKERLGQ